MRALISVSNKEGLIPFAKEIEDLGFEIISTGGTKRYLDEANIKTMSVEQVTGAKEILGGRVKTLHPLIHGGLLAIRDNDDHVKEVLEEKITYIDLVVVNLYPFKETILKPNVTFMDAIENIDIGGPSMLRSAAKNHRFVTVVCDPKDYDMVLNEYKEQGNTSLDTRLKLASKVFRHTASYDTLIGNYLTEKAGIETPEKLNLSFDLKQELRYGENPHQKGSFYVGSEKYYSLGEANKLHGKEMSYNNIQDANAALDILKDFEEPCCVALKHMNPCGVGIGKDINEAWDKAYSSDPVSIFGGIVCTNEVVNLDVATKMSKIFLEIIIAKGFTDEALELLCKKKNIRLLTVKMDELPSEKKKFVSTTGGILIQDVDNCDVDEIKCVTKLEPTKEEIKELLFLNKVCKHVKSNAIVVGKNYQTLGVGAGQMNRVGAAKIALEEAKGKGVTKGLFLASDAFFPFDDTVRLASAYGVTAIIQPGGSVRDEDSIKACDELGIKMIFTGTRHFKH